MVTVALLQVRLDDSETPRQRADRVAELVASQRGMSDLVMLPELWTVGAFATRELRAMAEPLDGPWTARMSLAARTAGAWLHAGSFAERDGERLFNTSVLFDPEGEPVAVYRKIHLFGFGEGESSVFASGDDVVVVRTPLGPTGLSTCYDLRFPELYRAQVDKGATAFLVAAAWPTARIGAWSVLSRARAAENQAWLLACNAVGESAGVALGGHSRVVSPGGDSLGAARRLPGSVRVNVDERRSLRMRRRFPVLADRRSE